jgi:hypothetical protein
MLLAAYSGVVTAGLVVGLDLGRITPADVYGLDAALLMGPFGLLTAVVLRKN